jgi:hypothetical protein
MRGGNYNATSKRKEEKRTNYATLMHRQRFGRRTVAPV